MKLEKICTNCNQPYQVYICNIRKSSKTFCTIKCYGKWQKGKSFEDMGRAQNPFRFCSYLDCLKKHFGRSFCKKHYSFFIEKGGIKKRNEAVISSYVCLFCKKTFSVKKGKRKPKFCSLQCFGKNQKKPFIIKKGYLKILLPDHPRADKKGYVFEHIVIMERFLGRMIERPEEIHHIDGNRANNLISNLILYPDHKTHMREGHSGTRSK